MSPDSLAERIRNESQQLKEREPTLARPLQLRIDGDDGMAGLLSRVLAAELARPDFDWCELVKLFQSVYAGSSGLTDATTSDIEATLRRDPASDSALTVVLHQKGFHALATHRLAHALWLTGRVELARWLQGTSTRYFGVDIHPACSIGPGAMFDHGTGIVIGETSVIGTGVSILQAVTLGGTGNHRGDRHPKIGDGVLIGAGAILLGNITIGNHARIGAGSVVLRDVPAHMTVVGVPARSVVRDARSTSAESMDHNLLEP